MNVIPKLVALALLSTAALAQTDDKAFLEQFGKTFEQGGPVPAKDFVPEAQLQGALHTVVRPLADNDGLEQHLLPGYAIRRGGRHGHRRAARAHPRDLCDRLFARAEQDRGVQKSPDQIAGGQSGERGRDRPQSDQYAQECAEGCVTLLWPDRGGNEGWKK